MPKGCLGRSLSAVATGALMALSAPIALAELAPNGHARYGCCLINKDASPSEWEFEDDVPYLDCYRSAHLVGNPFEFQRYRAFAFYRDQKCSNVLGRPEEEEHVPVLWTESYRSGS